VLCLVDDEEQVITQDFTLKLVVEICPLTKSGRHNPVNVFLGHRGKRADFM
jgi:hypothetical protein